MAILSETRNPDLLRMSALDDSATITERMPGLALPFALVATSVAFFSILAFGAAFDGIRHVSPLFATGLAIPVGALAGTLLRRWRALHDPLRMRDSLFIAVGAIVVVAGGSIGAAVGISAWNDPGPCMTGGIIAGVAFLPSCVTVVEASRRAARARMGSIVAGVDRRTALATLLVVVAIAATTQAPALLVRRYTWAFPIIIQALSSIVVSGATAVAIARLYALDRAALARFDGLVREAPSFDRAEPNETGKAFGQGIDLGLGADRWTRTTGVDTYRTTSQREVGESRGIDRRSATGDPRRDGAEATLTGDRARRARAEHLVGGLRGVPLDGSLEQIRRRSKPHAEDEREVEPEERARSFFEVHVAPAADQRHELEPPREHCGRLVEIRDLPRLRQA